MKRATGPEKVCPSVNSVKLLNLEVPLRLSPSATVTVSVAVAVAVPGASSLSVTTGWKVPSST
jgi:hypothetical protein